MSDFNYKDYLRNNLLLKEEKVGKKEWESMNDDKRMDALLSTIKDPDEAEKYVERKWNDLPSTVTQNMRVDEGLEFDEDFGTGGREVESLAKDVVMGRISYKDAREIASKEAFSMKELNNAIAYIEDITGKSAPSYSLSEDEDYDPDAEQDDENVGMGYDDEGRPLGEAKDPRQIEAEREIRDQAKVFFLQKLRRGEIDTLPEDPFQAYMDMLTQDQMDHDAETLRRELGENKLSEAYKIGDEVILRGNSTVTDVLKVVSMRKKSGSDLMAYKVEFPNGEVAEYDETQLSLNPFRKKEKMNERLDVSRNELRALHKEVGATTFSQMVLNLRDENTLDELLETMKSQYVGLMSEARDYGMTYPSYKVEEFNTIGDMAQNGILNLLAFAEQHKPELAGKLKSLVNDVTEVIYDDMEEFDTQPRISVKKKLDEKVKAKLVKGLEKNKKDIKEHVELLSEEKDEEKIQTHKTRLQELLDARKKAEKLLEQEEEDAPIDKQMDKFKFTQQQQTLLKSAIQNQPTKFREVLLNLMQQVDDLTQGDESNNSVVKSAIAVLGRGL
jgi:hypothetical protein